MIIIFLTILEFFILQILMIAVAILVSLACVSMERKALRVTVTRQDSQETIVKCVSNLNDIGNSLGQCVCVYISMLYLYGSVFAKFFPRSPALNSG